MAPGLHEILCRGATASPAGTSFVRLGRLGGFGSDRGSILDISCGWNLSRPPQGADQQAIRSGASVAVCFAWNRHGIDAVRVQERLILDLCRVDS